MKKNKNQRILNIRKCSYLLAAFVLTLSYTFAQNTPKYPFRDPNLGTEKRVADLLSRLTPDEKVSQMMNGSAAIERLGIPAYDWWSEALHGIGYSGTATVFPQAIGLAATFNDKEQVNTYTIVSDEGRAKYNENCRLNGSKLFHGVTFWTPNINIFRDPRWGRGQETYGEDPYLTSRMGTATVKGLQGDDEKYYKAHACAKHFAVHSGPESLRHSFDDSASPVDLYETYLPAFKTLVQDANVQEVMCAYQRFDSQPCCGSNKLLVQILRKKWGYDGLIVSDCGAINDFYQKGHHETYQDSTSASSAAVLSGTDIECGDSYKSLVRALKNGQIREADLDVSLRRIIRARIELGLLDPDSLVKWNKLPYNIVANDDHNKQALKAARESIVLLKNANNTLPLNKKIRKIAVVGPNADNVEMMWGNYSGTPKHTTTILNGIKEKLTDSEVIYKKGCEYVGETWYESKLELGVDKKIDYNGVAQSVADADVIVFAGGINSQLEGEESKVKLDGFAGGDRTKIELPEVQRKFLEALHKTGKPVVFVLCSGSAIGLGDDESNYDALVEAWYPGQAGGTAVADVLFGDYNPAGRLPVTFYKSTAQLPGFENYSMEGRTYRYLKDKPLYPFGFGLSYTDFYYSNATLNKNVIKSGEDLNVSVEVKNTGSVDGDEVVQVYVKRLNDDKAPVKSLKEFRRINIPAGEECQLNFTLPSSAFEFYDPETDDLVVKSGKYLIFVGGSSMETDLKSVSLTITN